MRVRPCCAMAGLVATLCPAWIVSAAQTATPAAAPAASASATPVMQLALDEKAFKAARAITDQRQREKALKAFLRDYPNSKRAQTAREALLKALLEESPRNAGEIHQIAKAYVDGAEAGERAGAENGIAYDLAEALPQGVDLKAAEAWSKDGMSRTTLTVVTREINESCDQAKVPRLSAEAMHQAWADNRAASLETLADIYFAEGRLADASEVLRQAMALHPGSDSGIHGLLGQIAHSRHADAEALEDLEVAATLGDFTERQHALLERLYAGAHAGSAAGLEAEIDRRYESLPQPFTPTPHVASAKGHTVLVELYSGSGCEPCVAADYGIDGVLKAYPREDVVVLTMGMHAPVPDPLANPDTVARANYDGVDGIPWLKVDGQHVEGVLGDRSGAKSSFEKIEQAIDTNLGKPTGVAIQLAAKMDGRAVESHASVQIDNAAALREVLASGVAPGNASPAMTEVKAGTPDTVVGAAQTPTLVLNFALVEQVVRYIGENGVRFHRMVVRALAKPTDEGFPVTLAGASSASFVFDPESISKGLASYLTAYEQHNERFGTAHFRVKDTSLPLDQLGVAAWVEDLRTHRVVAASYVPLQAEMQEAAR